MYHQANISVEFYNDTSSEFKLRYNHLAMDRREIKVTILPGDKGLSLYLNDVRVADLLPMDHNSHGTWIERVKAPPVEKIVEKEVPTKRPPNSWATAGVGGTLSLEDAIQMKRSLDGAVEIMAKTSHSKVAVPISYKFKLFEPVPGVETNDPKKFEVTRG